MSTFRIGLRVRVVYCANPHLFGDHAGHEGVIVGELYPTKGGECWQVALDGSPFRADGRRHLFLPEQLEPIQPSGHRSGDYSYTELMDRCRAGEGVPA